MENVLSVQDVIWRGDVREIGLVIGFSNVNTSVGGNYPLEIAVLRAYPDLEVVQCLIGLGADPNKISASGLSIIEQARKMNRPNEIIDALANAALCFDLQNDLPEKSLKSSSKGGVKI
jgi:ankyrin repeat protein